MGCSAPRPKPHSLRTLNRCPIVPEPPESFNCRHWKILIVVRHFMRILVTFPSIIVATAAAISERILQNAVDIKSENDLTV
jgi:hypothetical protein